MAEVRARPEVDVPEVAPAQTPPRTPGDGSAGEARPGRRWAGAAVVAVAVLLVAEVGVRLIDDRLVDPLVWPSVESQQKVEQMDVLEGFGGVDAVAVGSSLVNGDLVPEVFMEAMGDGTTMYNAGLSAGIPLLTEPWTRHVVLPRLDPELLVIGVSSFDFYDHPSSDAFEAAFADSAAGAEALGEESLLETADRWAGKVSELWANRMVLRDPENLADAVRGNAPEPEGEFGPVTDFGRTAYGEDGVEVVQGAAAGPPVDGWELGDRNRAALGRVVTDAVDRGIEVVLVAMPVTQAYVDRHPNGDDDYELFHDELREFARIRDARVIELDEDRDAARFIDQVHLRPAEAESFTRELVAALQG